jgi:hypothetical protein
VYDVYSDAHSKGMDSGCAVTGTIATIPRTQERDPDLIISSATVNARPPPADAPIVKT